MNRNDIISAIEQEIELFKDFDCVFLFGSVLNDGIFSHDVDLLLIYQRDVRAIMHEVNPIVQSLGNILGYPIDVTVLSIAELKQTKFLDKLLDNYVVIK
ncbi:hypothetical protein [Lacticaseibacillus paracasei]|uniref:Polymerase beta nucleotidyltransferase domain-containing protein n=1 Tax=Lacticaseibacillus paracasei NRIC 0644 TaxID=1435038 RepID=A0A0C9NYC7_LACPA|nr:hypothetical protein [Lacticaseibacillus paracasei]GAN37015.1 hypothetical protein LC0644_1604 [Lacticaseibacillus paracasei NRIC 0644]GAN39783.1 hypothetical protein LC1917_1660 [Lacticaseibacillus paracasei NRIC 1917]